MSRIIEALTKCYAAFAEADMNPPTIQIDRREMQQLKADIRHSGFCTIRWNGNDYDVFAGDMKIEVKP